MATKVKSKKSVMEKAKTAIKQHGESMKTAYNVGFTDGWAAATKIPNKTGARAAAVKGYGDGIYNRRKSNNSTRKLDKAKNNR